MKTYLISEKTLNEVLYFLGLHKSELLCEPNRFNNLLKKLRNLESVEHGQDDDDYGPPFDKFDKNVIYKGNSNLKVKMTE